MIRVEQTRMEIGTGNCMQACLASIFELPIEDIPDWNKNGERDWETLYDDWLADYGLGMVIIGVTNDTYQEFPHLRDIYHLATYKSPRFKCSHSVVMKNYEVVWDPHPKRDMGLGDAVDVIFFVPLELPALIMNKLRLEKKNEEC